MSANLVDSERSLVTAHYDGSIRVWDTAKGTIRHVLVKTRRPLHALPLHALPLRRTG